MLRLSHPTRRWATSVASVLMLLTGCARAAETTVRPASLATRGVTATATTFGGRAALTLELTADEQAILRTSGGNRATYALLRDSLTDGVIEADVAAELTGRGGAESRGFIGFAVHVAATPDVFEGVYLRMTNGSRNVPPPPAPRDVRAVQYFAHPDFHFDVSRERAPGRYEKGAPVALGAWHRLRLEIAGARATAFVDGVQVLDVTDLRLAGRRGPVGLWIGDGTRGHFANVRVSPR
jgi:hypothetical protein